MNWERYEQEKLKLQQRDLKPEEYEQEVRKLLERLDT